MLDRLAFELRRDRTLRARAQMGREQELFLLIWSIDGSDNLPKILSGCSLNGKNVEAHLNQVPV
jgi:hypothetical protein